MESTQYTAVANAWSYTEDHLRGRENQVVIEARIASENPCQAAEGELLRALAKMSNASSVIVIGNGALIETIQLARGLKDSGQITVIDSTDEGIAATRKAFAELKETSSATLRAVNARADVFLPRLNANDYDMIVVAGDATDCGAAFGQAPRLLREHGFIVFMNALALADGNGGVPDAADRSERAVAMRSLIGMVEVDEEFDTVLSSTGHGMLIAVKN